MVNELNPVVFISTRNCMSAPSVYGYGSKNWDYGRQIWEKFREPINREAAEQNGAHCYECRREKLKGIARDMHIEAYDRDIFYFNFRNASGADSFYLREIPNLLIDRIITEPEFKPPRNSEQFNLLLAAVAYFSKDNEMMHKIQTIQRKDLSPLIIPAEERTIEDFVEIFIDPIYAGISAELRYKYGQDSNLTHVNGYSDNLSEKTKEIKDELIDCLARLIRTSNNNSNPMDMAESKLHRYLDRYANEEQLSKAFDFFGSMMGLEKKRANKEELERNEIFYALSIYILLGNAADYVWATNGANIKNRNNGRHIIS